MKQAGSHRSSEILAAWVVIPRFLVWLIFMASGVVVIPLSIAMCIAYFPAGVPVFITWREFAEGIHTWMLGRMSFLGESIKIPVRPAESESVEVVQSVPGLCPACGYKCLSENGTPKQCPNCTYLFGIERKIARL